MRYTILSGRHNDKGLLKKLWFFRLPKRKMEFKIFLEHNNYYAAEQVRSSGKDKIIGFGGLDPHKNSARVVSQPSTTEGLMNYYAYCYLDGERVIKNLLMNVRNGLEYIGDIQALQEGYLFHLDGQRVFIEWDGSKPRWRRFDYYHGGNDKSYWTMVAVIKTKIINFLNIWI